MWGTTHSQGMSGSSFFSAAAAKKFSQAGHVSLGVTGGLTIKLTPYCNSGCSWHAYAIVSSDLPNSDFAKATMLLQHFELLTATAQDMASGMGRRKRLQTAQPTLFFYNKAGEVLQPSQVTVDNVHSVFFAPMRISLEDISAEELAGRAGSLGGLKCCLLPADALTATLCLFCSSHKNLENSRGSTTPFYSTHGSSSVGRSLPATQHDPANMGRGRSRGRGRVNLPGPRSSTTQAWNGVSNKPSKASALAASLVMAQQNPVTNPKPVW